MADIMNKLEELINTREKLRTEEKELTKQITLERKAQATNKKPVLKVVSYEDYAKLQSENANLRGLIGLLKKADSSTYKEVGAILNLSPERARQVVARGKKYLSWIDKQDK